MVHGLQGCLRGQTINSLGCPPIWAPYSPVGWSDFGLTAVLIECSAIFEVTLSMKSELELSLFFLRGEEKRGLQLGGNWLLLSSTFKLLANCSQFLGIQLQMS